ncbi:MAG: NnrS family protein [Alphaproteobacteria bacterium]|nr:MAG: NnrS family protein [Alphaproteobacteria bacterium]
MPAPSSMSLFEHPMLGRGFRPFFLLAASYSAVSLLGWTGYNAGLWGQPGSFVDPVLWHAHEMIYGFVLAVVAGFLLTAVANWTGGAPVRQLHLMGLCLLWIAGRITMNVNGLPLWLTAVADNLFIPALAVSLSLPLLKAKNTRNFIFLGLLTALFSCNVAFFIMQDRLPLHVAVLVIIAMISLVGGRIIPAFTVAGLRRTGLVVYQQDQSKLDILCLLSMAGVAASFVLAGAASPVTGLAAVAAAVLHLARFRHYHTLKVFKDPMLWILHAGYAWLVLGLLMLGLAGFGLGMLTVALHALTTGCIGSMCIGMMCRVTLGHTGRHLLARPMTVLMFGIMQLAAILRVLGPVVLPGYYIFWIAASGILWALCFALYLPVYAPMLVKPRPDGLPA